MRTSSNVALIKKSMKTLMSGLVVGSIVFVSIGVFGPATAYAAGHTARVGNVIAPDRNRPCAFFTMIGVAQADPAVPGPFFAVRQNHRGFSEIYAVLLAAKLTGVPVRANTSGSGVGACSNHAEVHQVYIP